MALEALEKLKKNFQKLENCKFYQRTAKISDKKIGK